MPKALPIDKKNRSAYAHENILLMHSEARDYRIPLFERLNDKHSIKFVFFNPLRLADKSEAARKWDYRYLWSLGGLGYSSNIAPGLLYYLWGQRPRLLILSDCSSYSAHVGYLYCRLTKTPYILFDVQWHWPGTLKGRAALPLTHALIRHAGALVAGGGMTKDFYLRMGAIEEKVFTALNSSLDMEERHSGEERLEKLRRRLKLSGKTVVLFVGRLKRYKGVDTLIEAYSLLRREIDDAALVIVGDGEEAGELKSLAKIEKLSDVHFVGNIPSNEVADYYFVSDFLVHPARFLEQETVNCEAWGLVVNEAMSAGLPVIASTAVGAAYDLVENDKNGFVILPEDIEALKDSMLKLCKDDELRRRMGAESRERVKALANFEQMEAGFTEAFDFALNRS